MRNSQFYNKHFTAIDINKISIASFSQLPVTLKDDFDLDSKQFYAVKNDSIVDIVHTSGTSGSPNYIGYSESDLKRLEYNELQALSMCGIRNSDTILLTCTIDKCFIAGLAYFLGSRAIGATAIRSGANPLITQLKLIKDLKPTVIIGVPTFLQKLAKFANESGFDLQKAGVKKLICIGEPLRDSQMKTTPLTSSIESLWNAKAFSTYASSETVTSFCECESQYGGHLIPELAIVEILDDNNNLLPNGEIGEVTVTPFHTEAMPLIRYKTGDMAAIIDKPCKCGRNSLRLSSIVGRKNQMIKCKGTKFYPNAIHNILDNIPNVNLYQIIVTKNNLSDQVTIKLSLKNSDELPKIQSIIKAELRVNVDIILVEFKELFKNVFPETTRKPIKYKID